MSNSSLGRRKFLGVFIAAGAAWTTFAACARALAAAGQVACRKISYPAKGQTMSMDDIADIDRFDALILQSSVLDAQNAYTGDELGNEVVRLGGMPESPINPLLKAQRAATLAQREGPSGALKNQWIAVALCQDIGRIRSPENSTAYAASALRPYIDDSIYQVLKVYPAFEAHPDRYSDRAWYKQGLQFLDWNKRAVAENFTPGALDGFVKIVKDLVHVSASSHPPDEKVIPEFEG
jgi:predicted HD phosphohydrolase